MTPTPTYRAIDPQAIVDTSAKLASRVAERFPDSGLSKVSEELHQIAQQSADQIEALRRPHWPIRIGVGVGLLIIAAAGAGLVLSLQIERTYSSLSDLVQGMEAAVNDVVFLGVGIYFLFTIEQRVKRRAAFKSLHELRSMAHVIDMHQLTKDPEQLLSPTMATASSPARTMTRFALARYLDYCSEMLSITSKLAALYVQHFTDGLILSAVNDIQTLTGSLSAKIWQKIVILDALAIRDTPLPAVSHQSPALSKRERVEGPAISRQP